MTTDDAKQVPGPDAAARPGDPGPGTGGALGNPPAVEMIEHCGVVYHLPLADRFRRHTPAERKGMAASARAGGIQQPIWLYDDATLDLQNCVLDGQGRLETAVVVGAEVPTVHVGRLTTAEAYERALTLNDDRRHDTPEAIRQRREDRLRRVAAKRADGMSVRAIAEQEGVHPNQVQRDLKAADVAGVHSVYTCPPDHPTGCSGVPPGTPEPGAQDQPPGGSGGCRIAPESAGPGQPIDPGHPPVPPPAPKKIRGRDGRQYAARRNAQPRPAPAGEAVDGLGRPVPANLRDAFADEFMAAAAGQLDRLAGQLQSASSWAAWLPPTVPGVLRTAAADVRGSRPFAVHQGCAGLGCEACLCSGHLPRWQQHDLEAERGAGGPAAAPKPVPNPVPPPGVPALPGVYVPRIVDGRPGHQVVLDAFSNPVPAGVGDAFADPGLRDLLVEAVAAAEILEGVFQQLAKLKAGAKAATQHPWVELPAAEADLVRCRNAAVAFADRLRAGLPYAVCPRCSGAGCKDCRLSGYWTKTVCDRNPELFRQKKGA